MDFKKQIIDELHKPARKNFPRRNVITKGLSDSFFQAELIEMKPYSKVNKGYNYILNVINCFSKKGYSRPVKSKSGKDVTDAMKSVLQEIGIAVKHLQTDDGKEFYNSLFKNLMKNYGINHYSTKSELKASIVERFNRTIKSIMHRLFSLRGSYQWLDMLQDIVREYNTSFHRTIGMKPSDVNKKNEKLVLSRIKHNTIPRRDLKPPKRFILNDKVRISKFKHIFQKGYLPSWTNEVFTIYRVQPTTPVTYILKDNRGEILQGGFYGHELQKSYTDNVYLVQKILKKKGDSYLVSWLGFDSSHNTWISKKDLI